MVLQEVDVWIARPVQVVPGYYQLAVISRRSLKLFISSTQRKYRLKQRKMEGIIHDRARPFVKKAWDLTHHPKKEPTKLRATATTRLTGQRHLYTIVPYRDYVRKATDMTPAHVLLSLRPNIGRRAEPERKLPLKCAKPIKPRLPTGASALSNCR